MNSPEIKYNNDQSKRDQLRLAQRRGCTAGFTLVELLIYVTLSAVVIGLFGGILITATRIQGEQTASASVTSDLNFLSNTIRGYVHDSVSYTVGSATQVQLATDHGTTRTIVYDADTKLISLTDNGPGGEVVSQLSSSRIRIDDVTFTDIRNGVNGSSTALQFSITASASTTDPGRQATRNIESTASSFVQEQ